ncbi:MAG: hypothetical protein MJ108_06020 [Saccharofermentans sp.]|nr:hypothetical protein [Clostridia bacterium]MCQ2528661.1 hypothetical protein [Saccharofermentans sp.]
MDIISVGYYKEMPHGKIDSPSIKDVVGKEQKELIEKICDYLASGVTLVTSPGVANDVINPDRGEIGTLSAMTDGTWLWPGDLAYYVKNYKLKLPEAFLKTMEANEWSSKLKLEDIDFDSLTIDGMSPFEA